MSVNIALTLILCIMGSADEQAANHPAAFLVHTQSHELSLCTKARCAQECSPAELLPFSLLSSQQGHCLTFLMSSVIPSSHACFDAIDFIAVARVPKGFFSDPAKHAVVRHFLTPSS